MSEGGERSEVARLRRRAFSVDELAEGVLAGERALIGRAITLVESANPDAAERAQALLLRLQPHAGAARRVGISGVPGAGKSTFIEALGTRLVDEGQRVAVLAVDPSSELSGGSILGDKTRMERLAQREEAFIRPSPSGGTLGGVARRTRETMIVLEAAGFDVVIVETVGVGQSETIVAGMVDAFVVLTISGAGDELQGIKRGILELADLVAVNKADGDNAPRAERAARELRSALELFRPRSALWTTRVVTLSALEGRGIGELWELLEERRRLLEESGEQARRRREQRLAWTWSLVEEAVLDDFRRHPEVARRAAELERAVIEERATPAQVARRLLQIYRGR